MQRILSAAGLLALVVGVVWLLPPLATLLLVQGILLLAYREYAAMAASGGARMAHGPTAAALLGVVAVFALAPAMLPLVLLAVLLGGAVVQLARWPQQQMLAPVAAAAFAVLYLALPLAALAVIRAAHGREALLLLLATLVVSDTAQYYGGRWLGRRPLAPAVSPGKTVEGALFGLAAAPLLLWTVGAWGLADMPAAARALLGVLLALFGIAGDLFESTLKRDAGMKDSSSVIPGHGGVLDRIDALLFAAPVYYLVLELELIR